MKIKNPIILTILLIIISVLLTGVLVVLTLPQVIGTIIGILTFELVFYSIPPILAAIILKKIYIKVNKKIIPRKTKLIIVISYFVLQQIMGIIFFLIGVEANLPISFLLQLGVAILIYLGLSSLRKI